MTISVFPGWFEDVLLVKTYDIYSFNFFISHVKDCGCNFVELTCVVHISKLPEIEEIFKDKIELKKGVLKQYNMYCERW